MRYLIAILVHLKRWNIEITVNAAAYHQEVLIYGDIPQEAIIGFPGGD